MRSKSVYLDYNATTPLAPEVLEAMLPYLTDDFGNPSSIHGFGQRSKDALYQARDKLASAIGAQPSEVLFTSGGTEADNLAIRGVLSGNKSTRRHLVTSTIEHHAVLHVMNALEKEGWPVTYVDVDNQGRINLELFMKALRADTLLVSVMAANNETGVVQPVRELAEAAHRAGAFFHTDAVQTCGKVFMDVKHLGVDLLSLSAHKFLGPKGSGALYIRQNVPFKAMFRGGSQERARRPGTENPAGIVGLSEALVLAVRMLPEESERLEVLRERLAVRVIEDICGVHVNGGQAKRIPNTLNLRFDDADGERIAVLLDRKGFAVSTGAACSAGAVEPSHVLLAMGHKPEEVQGSIRVSIGRYTTAEDIDIFATSLSEVVRVVRSVAV